MDSLIDSQTLHDLLILTGLLMFVLTFGLVGVWMSKFVFEALRKGIGFVLGATAGALLFAIILSAIQPYFAI